MKHVVLCHRWGGSPDSVWYPWAQRELEIRGFNVDVPPMPAPDAPRLDAWLPAFTDAVGEPDEHTLLMGHSLGCATVLRYLEQIGENRRVGGVVLVAGFTDAMGNDEISSFFQSPFDFSVIRAGAGGCISIHSNNDPAAAPDYLKHAMIFLDALDARILLVPNGGHFSEAENCVELPEAILAADFLNVRRNA